MTAALCVAEMSLKFAPSADFITKLMQLLRGEQREPRLLLFSDSGLKECTGFIELTDNRQAWFQLEAKRQMKLL